MLLPIVLLRWLFVSHVDPEVYEALKQVHPPLQTEMFPNG
jgi:hypothetical protein